MPRYSYVEAPGIRAKEAYLLYTRADTLKKNDYLIMLLLNAMRDYNACVVVCILT